MAPASGGSAGSWHSFPGYRGPSAQAFGDIKFLLIFLSKALTAWSSLDGGVPRLVSALLDKNSITGLEKRTKTSVGKSF